MFPEDGEQEREVRGGREENSYKNSLEYLPGTGPGYEKVADGRWCAVEGWRDGDAGDGAGWGWVVRGKDRKDER